MLFAERTQDFAFYLRATAGLGPDDEVLELGIGDGRVALVLAAHGRNVHGIDASEAMLTSLDRRIAEAPAASGRITRELADTRTVRIGRKFARVICPFNGIAHFHDHDALAAYFATVRAHLIEGGSFAFDAIIPDSALLRGSSAFVPWVRHPRTGAICRVEESYTYDGEARVLTITTTFVERETEERQVLELALRQFFPEEMPALLARHGFTIVERTPEIGDALAYVCR
jgi:SAM-dependent methyltransferase